MAGRKRLPPQQVLKLHEAPLARGRSSLTRQNPSIDDPFLAPHVRHSPPPSSAAARAIPVAVLEDRAEAQHRQIQSLLVDNQRLAATHVALKQDLAAAQQELRQLTTIAADVKAGRDAEVREIYEKSLKMDAEVRAIDAMSSELVQVRTDIQDLGTSREELALQLQAVETELMRIRSDSQQVPVIKAEIEVIRHEIQRGRNAVEYEKKIYGSNLEQSQTMAKNMAIMALEVENLRAELAKAESRARAAVAVAVAANSNPGYPASYDNPEMGYGAITYTDSSSMHQIHAGVDAYPQYTSGAMLHHPFDPENTNVQN